MLRARHPADNVRLRRAGHELQLVLMSLQKETAARQRFGEAGRGGFDVRQRRLQDLLQLEHGDRPVEGEEHSLERGGEAGRVAHLRRTIDHRRHSVSFLSCLCTVISANGEACATRASPILISSSSARKVTTASNRVRAWRKMALKLSCA